MHRLAYARPCTGTRARPPARPPARVRVLFGARYIERMRARVLFSTARVMTHTRRRVKNESFVDILWEFSGDFLALLCVVLGNILSISWDHLARRRARGL